MKILMVVTEGNLGGAQRHVLDVSRELVRRGHHVSIVVGGTFMDLSIAAVAERPEIPVIQLPNLVRQISPKRDLYASVELFRLVRAFKPNIIHCHSSKAGVLASIVGRIAGARVVYTAHGFVFREELGMHTRQFYEWSERIASWFRHKVIAVSQSDADAARSHHVVSARKLITIPNGIDVDLANDLQSRAAARSTMSGWCGADVTHAKIVLSIANFYQVKNIPLLIRAFEYVVPRVPDARLVLIGDGEQRALCEKIVAHSNVLRDKVFFVGKRPQAYQILRGADMLCLASTKEGMPYVVLEAKLAGTPVVATRVGGIPEMGEGEDLKLVVPHSAEMLSDAIVEMIRQPYSEKNRLTSVFTLIGMVNAIEEVYRQVTTD